VKSSEGSLRYERETTTLIDYFYAENHLLFPGSHEQH
jgi:hypothetical protein